MTEEEDWKAEQEFKEYCGFSCSEIKEKQQAIIDELIDFNKHNPEYSMVMLGKLMEMLYESRQQMIRKMGNPTAVVTNLSEEDKDHALFGMELSPK